MGKGGRRGCFLDRGSPEPQRTVAKSPTVGGGGWVNTANPQCPQATFRRYLLSTCYVQGPRQAPGCRDRSWPP